MRIKLCMWKFYLIIIYIGINMSFEPKRQKTGGRVAGVPNKHTKAVKDAVLQVFNELQEDENHNLVAFAKKFPKDFYNIAAKLIPTEIKGTVDTKVITVIPPNKK